MHKGSEACTVGTMLDATKRSCRDVNVHLATGFEQNKSSHENNVPTVSTREMLIQLLINRLRTVEMLHELSELYIKEAQTEIQAWNQVGTSYNVDPNGLIIDSSARIVFI